MLQSAKRIISIFCVAVLLASFGLHSVQVKHVHQHAHASEHAQTNSDSADGTTESLTEKMHMAEKKFVVFMLGATVLFFVFVSIPHLSYQRIRLSLFSSLRNRQKQLIHILFSYIRLFFSSGILNPKLY